MKFDIDMKGLKIDGERKWIIIAGIVLLIIAIVYRVMPDEGFFSASDTSSMKKQQIIKYRELINQKGELEQKISSLKKAVASSSVMMLEGGSPALAAVDLQNIINLKAAQSEIKIKSVDVVKEKQVVKDGVYLSVPVRLTFDADVRQVKDFVYSIESDAKYLTITDLACTVSASDSRMVNTVLTVEGYMPGQAE